MLDQSFILVLLCAVAAAQTCNYQQRICQCEAIESECYFDLIVEDLQSLTSYKLVQSESGTLVRQLNANSWSYIIDNMGQLTPRGGGVQDSDRCRIYNERFFENNCSIPMIIDSVTDGNFIAVNGLIPGPTLVVNYNQTVIINVMNSLINEEISIHWHGLFQNNTPWMDGVDHITQCPIPTYATFRHIFKASPPGTMWYHSHVGTQRTEGLFGALIVREPQDIIDTTQRELQEMINETFTIVDDPEHVLSFLDWQRENGVEITLKTVSNNPFFDVLDNFTLERNISRDELPFARLGPDGSIVSRIPFDAGLINGLGKQKNIRYPNSRLSIFNVQYYRESSPVYYRFRLVGAQRHEMFRFSIAEHKLFIIATDGYLTEPIEVDYILIHAGERYDFLLKPKTEEETNEMADFLIIAETLDSENISLSNTNNFNVFAFLHYGNEIEDGLNPSSTEYEQIIEMYVMDPRDCSSSSVCIALNCPFKFYDPSRFINCRPVTDMQLLFPTPDDLVPSNTIQMNNEHFFDFAFTGSSASAAINGRNFAFPSGSLQTQLDNSSLVSMVCKPGFLDCTDDRDQCICTQIIDINDPWGTIQFVITAIGGTDRAAHPVHLHGHTFQVAGIFYGEYNASGYLIAPNPDVTCHNDSSCTNPGWTNSPVDGSVTSKTVRKDTVVVPAGGYVVIRFVSDNWGFWYMHCHIEPHFLEGMAVVVNEAYELQNLPPLNQSAQQCGDFYWTLDDFNDKLSNPISRGGASPTTDGSAPVTTAPEDCTGRSVYLAMRTN